MKIKLIDFGFKEKPFRAHDNDAGADVFAPSRISIEPGRTCKIPLGFGLEIPDGYVGFIFPRSSLSAQGIICELPPIDSGYRGEIHAIITNHSSSTYRVQEGDRIGQIVILPTAICDFHGETETGKERGNGAFGSTGK